MKKLLTICLLLVTCAPNPDGIEAGDWVTHKITGQKYFVTELRQDLDSSDGGRVRVKNEDGSTVDGIFRIHELQPWVDPNIVNVSAPSTHDWAQALYRLREAQLALEKRDAELGAKSVTAEQIELEQAIEQAEETIFGGTRQWNPITKQYE